MEKNIEETTLKEIFEDRSVVFMWGFVLGIIFGSFLIKFFGV